MEDESYHFDRRESCEDDYYEDDFEESSNEDKPIDQYDVYQERLNKCELREVASQSKHRTRHYSTIGVETDSISACSKTIQCFEGEDDTYFVSLLDHSRQQMKIKTVHAAKDDLHDAQLVTFVDKFTNVFESILVEDENKHVLQTGKPLVVSFGESNPNDRGELDKKLQNSILSFVDCFQTETSMFITMHSVDRNDKEMNSLDDTPKTIICIWKSSCPKKPFMTMTSDSTIGRHCICVLKDQVIVCGTNEGFLQLCELKQSFDRQSSTKMAKQYSIYDSETIENHRCNIRSIANIANIMIASLDNLGVVELWKLKHCDDTKRVELERFRVIESNQSRLCEAIFIIPSPKGDSLLCPLNDGRVTLLNVNETKCPESVTTYYPDCLMEGNYENMYESNVDEIVFSPFDQEIFLLKWTNGLIGLFHVNYPIAFSYWNTWNYLSQHLNLRNEKDRCDDAISIKWCSKHPCRFHVLTKLGYFLIFDMSQVETSIIIDKFNKVEHECLKGSISFIKLVASGSDEMLPKVVTKTPCSNIFSVTSRRINDANATFDEAIELEKLRKRVKKK